MNILRQVFILISINYIGNLLSGIFGLVIPGNVLGFLILFLLLFSKIIKPIQIEKVSNLLLFNLTFLFIPSGVSLINILDKLKSVWIQILIISILSTIITIIVTAFTIQLLMGDRNE
ncbi:holin-like protein/holin-like protein [Hypnocyclicus thermotrophus]|uniref:Holin-like protein/holin-like protein n=1 Tax=Hypnocyclicus thermotrophus TaxID=1627895 RepID=A0AA46I6A8_9FUSO|nr:CidA/LrgA family protein [Hypnocyclicus thermotrophus]TDT72354.1 holin-like protein/holin-like protein [Hypnocyclicus thermotrophus]